MDMSSESPKNAKEVNKDGPTDRTVNQPTDWLWLERPPKHVTKNRT